MSLIATSGSNVLRLNLGGELDATPSPSAQPHGANVAAAARSASPLTRANPEVPASPSAASAGGPSASTAGLAGAAPHRPSKPVLAAIPVPLSMWIPDEAVAACSAPECQQPFTLLNRRHHCRTCGRIFCHHCSNRTLIARDTGEFLRVCAGCIANHGLVVRKTHEDWTVRRRQRGVFKLLPLAILVRMMSFLGLNSIAACSLTCCDFYFAARDNRLWMQRIARGDYAPKGAGAAAGGPRGRVRPDTSALRYNYTAFVEFVRLAAECRDDTANTRVERVEKLLSKGFVVLFLGPEHVGKSLLADFCCFEPTISAGSPGGGSSSSANSTGSNALAVGPTTGVRVLTKSFDIQGDRPFKTNITVIDLSGNERHLPVWRLLASCCHAVVLCYDPDQRLSLGAAALAMESVDDCLDGQPVIVCGILKNGSTSSSASSSSAPGTGGVSSTLGSILPGALARPVRSSSRNLSRISTRDAEAISARCAASLHCVPSIDANRVLEAAVQGVVKAVATSKLTLERPTAVDILLGL